MPNEVIGICPVCSQPMEVTELECPVCHTKISGNFQLCKFCSLTPEQKGFAEVFIKNRGNIKEVERELGISYPTVRSRLESLIRALGYAVDEEVGTYADQETYAEERKIILDRLDSGEISVQEATKMLKRLGRR
ncbi:MAG TPA: DUF2089 domain-containing protein [Bacillota bacterium]|nr:DUF2089 domain-containing protein [Candidatus Fermentithermobacillaceae bacterium]HOB30262.1 DUF2089 domain-containing protein [Bacillota bacterium]HOK64129.1 DUF2089 domain-containing protein [Bacillota bacterium]HOL11638.1 DUF2089 domain-containing protein [Bacillota bacterium]HOQ02766.1 DUF2089 domain-containing protein [Bacillota bacterium]